MRKMVGLGESLKGTGLTYGKNKKKLSNQPKRATVAADVASSDAILRSCA